MLSRRHFLRSFSGLGVAGVSTVAYGFSEPELYLRAVVAAVDGSSSVRLSTTGSPIDADALGRALAQRMIEEGADGLMGERIP